MTKVKLFDGDSLYDIQEEINEWVENRGADIVNTSMLYMKDRLIRNVKVLVTYKV